MYISTFSELMSLVVWKDALLDHFFHMLNYPPLQLLE